METVRVPLIPIMMGMARAVAAHWSPYLGFCPILALCTVRHIVSGATTAAVTPMSSGGLHGDWSH